MWKHLLDFNIDFTFLIIDEHIQVITHLMPQSLSFTFQISLHFRFRFSSKSLEKVNVGKQGRNKTNLRDLPGYVTCTSKVCAKKVKSMLESE